MVGNMLSVRFNSIRILKYSFHLLRKRLHSCNNMANLFSSLCSTNFSQIQAEQIERDQLRSVCFCRSYSNFWTRQSRDNIISVTGDRAAYYVCNSKHMCTVRMSFTKCCQCISCFTGLADYDYQCFWSNQW
ncbi:hypothetical protein D3C81_1550150 [compost metagenome]